MGRKIDPTFYPVIYGIADDDDWGSEESWYKANPSLGHTIALEKCRMLIRVRKKIRQKKIFSGSSD